MKWDANLNRYKLYTQVGAFTQKAELGAVYHTLSTVPGDSGAPLFNAAGELCGLKVGVRTTYENGEKLVRPVAIGARQIFNFMSLRNMMNGKAAEGFVKVPIVVSSTIPVPHSTGGLAVPRFLD